MNRRTYLALAGASLTAGCSGQLGAEPPTPYNATAPKSSTEAPPTSTPSTGSGPDYLFISSNEMAAIKRRAKAGEEPWATGYSRLQNEVKTAMAMAPRSVVDQTSDEYPAHRFIARIHERDDYMALRKMGNAILDLGLMYYLTDQDRYAEQAIDFIHHWCLHPDTYMAPNGDALNVGPEIRIHDQIPKLWWGASFLRDHSYWGEVEASMPWTDDISPIGEDAETAFKTWARNLMESMPPAGYAMRDNHWMWRLVFYATTLAYLEEEALLDRTFDVWRGETEVPKGQTILNLDQDGEYYKDKDRPWNDYTQFAPNEGYMNQERTREEGYHYMAFDIEALSLVSEIGRLRGEDLYLYNAPTDPESGSTIRKLFNFMAPYAKDPSRWQWGTGTGEVQEQDWSALKGLFELAYSRWRARDVDRDVLADIALQRPFSSYYILRHPTLTHANRFELGVE